jgi:RNA polymerase sigma-70 factor (ECF subfamily)
MEEAAKISVNIAASKASNPAKDAAQNELTDRQLVDRCQRGDMDAYEALVNRYRSKVFSLAQGMLRNEQDAADMAQEAFVRGWLAIRKFKKTASFYTWIYRITHNLCIDFVRQRERRPTASFEEDVDSDASADAVVAPSTNPRPSDEARRRELRQQIDAALLELSPEHRAVVQLREFDGMQYADIARAVGCSIGTVMSRLHYARKHLQKLLKEVI